VSSAVEERFGPYGGRFVPETLIPALDELAAAWDQARGQGEFRRELDDLLDNYAGRPTPLTLAERFAPGKRLYLKREDLLHTGAHKLNNALGQVLLARRLGKRRPEPASTASRSQPPARASASSASCTWAPRTCDASAPTSSGCGCSAPR
jgi:tryptophan synthase beta chain